MADSNCAKNNVPVSDINDFFPGPDIPYMFHTRTSRSYGFYCYKRLMINTFQKYYLSTDNSDVTFIVQGKEIPAHRFVVAAESPFFKLLLYGDRFSEAGQKRITIEAPIHAFYMMLSYMYGKQLNLIKMTVEKVLDLLELAHRYELPILQRDVAAHLENKITVPTVFAIFDAAELFKLPQLQLNCDYFLMKNSEAILNWSDLPKIRTKDLLRLATNDFQKPKQMSLALAIFKWIDSNQKTSKDEIDEVLSYIDITEFSNDDICKILRPSGKFDSTKLHAALESRKDILNKNYADVDTGFTIIEGKLKRYMLTCGGKYSTSESFDSNGRITYRLTLDLGSQCIVNYIQFRLNTPTFYSFAVSQDTSTWECLFPYQKFECFGLQKHYFEMKKIRYVSLASNDKFHCNSFKALHLTETLPTTAKVVCPVDNIVTMECARVIPNELSYSLLESSNVEEFPSVVPIDTAVIIKFNQPYFIESCSIRLWDYDESRQSFIVHGTTETGNEILFEGGDLIAGWTHIEFPGTVIPALSIKGKHTTANDFHFRLAQIIVPSPYDAKTSY